MTFFRVTSRSRPLKKFTSVSQVNRDREPWENRSIKYMYEKETFERTKSSYNIYIYIEMCALVGFLSPACSFWKTDKRWRETNETTSNEPTKQPTHGMDLNMKRHLDEEDLPSSYSINGLLNSLEKEESRDKYGEKLTKHSRRHIELAPWNWIMPDSWLN